MQSSALRLVPAAIAAALALPAVSVVISGLEAPGDPMIVEPGTVTIGVEGIGVEPDGGDFEYRLIQGDRPQAATPQILVAGKDVVARVQSGPSTLAFEELPPDYVPDFIDCYVTDAESARDESLRSADGVAALAFELPAGGEAQCELYVTYVEPQMSAPEPPEISAPEPPSPDARSARFIDLVRSGPLGEPRRAGGIDRGGSPGEANCRARSRAGGTHGRSGRRPRQGPGTQGRSMAVGRGSQLDRLRRNERVPATPGRLRPHPGQEGRSTDRHQGRAVDRSRPGQG